MSKRGGGAATLEQETQGELAIDIPDSALQLAIQYIPWDLIFPDPDQPRKEADAELRASIAAGGIRQPITVRARPGAIGQWMIVDGERRWRGAEGVQKSMPCVVRVDQEETVERMRTQLVSNTGKELSPVEEARFLQQLHNERGGSITDLAAFVGKPVTTVSQRLNLMQLGPWLDLIHEGKLSYTKAVEFLLPYRGCPDIVHEAARAELMPFLDDMSEYTAEDIAIEIGNAFRKHLYPIAKHKYDGQRPAFDVRHHDAECSCGGIEIAQYGAKRRHCGNPDWWQPKEKEAKKAARAKEKKKSGAGDDAPQSVVKVKRPFYAPEGAKHVGANYDLAVYTPLVGLEGKYSTAGVDGFDPTDLGAVAPEDLGVFGKAPGEVLLIKVTPAVKKAREKWALRRQTAREKVLASWLKTVTKKSDITVRRDSAREVMVAVMITVAHSDYDGGAPAALEAAAAVVGLELADDGLSWNVTPKQARQMLEPLTDAQTAQMLEVYATVVAKELDTPEEDLSAVDNAMFAAVSKLKHPWSKAPKVPKVGKAKDSLWDAEDEDGEGDDE